VVARPTGVRGGVGGACTHGWFAVFNEVDAFVPRDIVGGGTFVRVHCSVALDVLALGMFGRVVLVTHGFPKGRIETVRNVQLQTIFRGLAPDMEELVRVGKAEQANQQKEQHCGIAIVVKSRAL